MATQHSLSKLLEIKGITQAALARACGLSHVTIHLIISEKRRITPKVALEIARQLKCRAILSPTGKFFFEVKDRLDESVPQSSTPEVRA